MLSRTGKPCCAAEITEHSYIGFLCFCSDLLGCTITWHLGKTCYINWKIQNLDTQQPDIGRAHGFVVRQGRVKQVCLATSNLGISQGIENMPPEQPRRRKENTKSICKTAQGSTWPSLKRYSGICLPKSHLLLFLPMTAKLSGRYNFQPQQTQSIIFSAEKH